MNKYILPLAASFLLSSPWFGLAYHFHTQHAADVEAEAHAASWRAFCVAYGHDETTTAPEVINDYLDTWRGSVEEENALTPEQNNAVN